MKSFEVIGVKKSVERPFDRREAIVVIGKKEREEVEVLICKIITKEYTISHKGVYDSDEAQHCHFTREPACGSLSKLTRFIDACFHKKRLIECKAVCQYHLVGF